MTFCWHHTGGWKTSITRLLCRQQMLSPGAVERQYHRLSSLRIAPWVRLVSDSNIFWHKTNLRPRRGINHAPLPCFRHVCGSLVAAALVEAARWGASSNHAQLDWHVWRWGGCILKGGNIRTGAACRREASAKGACKFLTCPAYVNEPFFPLWYNYYEGILPLVWRSVSPGTYLMGWGRERDEVTGA